MLFCLLLFPQGTYADTSKDALILIYPYALEADAFALPEVELPAGVNPAVMLDDTLSETEIPGQDWELLAIHYMKSGNFEADVGTSICGRGRLFWGLYI